MSTITDAVKKRKKEVGEEGVQQIVPVSLEEPDVEVPKASGTRRAIQVVIVLLIVGAVGFGAVRLYKQFVRGRTPTRTAGDRLASSPEREVEHLPLDTGRQEALPSPAGAPERLPGSAPDKVVARAPEKAPELTLPGSRPTTVFEGPPAKALRAPSDRETAVWTPPAQLTGPVATVPPVGAEKSPPKPVRELPPKPAPVVPSGTGVVPQPAPLGQAAPAERPDPFAGIVLQGIFRFDPKSPEALINGKALKVGQSINGVEVVEIGTDSVKLRFGAVEKVISY